MIDNVSRSAAGRESRPGVLGWAILFTLILAAGTVRAEDEKSDPSVRVDLSTASGRLLSQKLQNDWPDHPEWLAMLADILQGSQLGPQDGWFRKAVAQTRYAWEPVQAQLDANNDGLIVRDEFPGTDADYDRLDRDRDGVLTSADFDWSAHALTRTPGAMLYYMADADGNGKVTPKEFQKLFERADGDGLGFLSQDDLRNLLQPPAPPRAPSGSTPPPDDGPSKLTLVKGLFRQEIGSLWPGPALNEKAPDFTLRTVDGDRSYTLSELEGDRPVVLVFGNFTCGPWRSQAGNVEKLYQRYRDRANFLMVYVREAHPLDGWHMTSNDRYHVSLAQPKTYQERVGVAQTCRRSLGFDMPFLVDTMDDQVGARYSGMPSRLYVLDRQGQVAYKSGRGPFGFKPGEMEQALLLLLTEQAVASDNPASSVRN